MNRFSLVSRVPRSAGLSSPKKKKKKTQSGGDNSAGTGTKNSDRAQTGTIADSSSGTTANAKANKSMLRGAHHLRRRRSSKASLASTGSMDSARSLAFADLAGRGGGRGQGTQQQQEEGSWSDVDRRLSQYSRQNPNPNVPRRRDVVYRSASLTPPHSTPLVPATL